MRPSAAASPRGIVEVDHGRRARREHLEQPLLGGEVRLHVAVIVEMVPRQVREHARRKPRVIDSLQGERVRRHFHHARATSASTICRNIRCTSGASGVVRDAGSSWSPTE